MIDKSTTGHPRDIMSESYSKLVTLLRRLFQLDRPELDFGIYRVLHARSDEVSRFLDDDFLPQIRVAFEAFESADRVRIGQSATRTRIGACG